jgi:hypothetical protein
MPSAWSRSWLDVVQAFRLAGASGLPALILKRALNIGQVSEIRVKPQHLDEHRSPISVVARMVDQLQAGRRRHAAPQMRGVVGLERRGLMERVGLDR